MNDLKVIGGPIADRAREYEFLPAAQSVLGQTIAEYMNFVTSTDERYSHIEAADRKKVAAECAKKQKWIEESMAKQAARPLYESLLITSAQIIEEKNRLINLCFPIINKPKPKTDLPSSAAASPSPDSAAKSPKNQEAEELLLTDEEDAQDHMEI